MVTQEDLQRLVKTQLQEQARKVARIIYTTCKDQYRESCEELNREYLTRLQQDGENVHDGALTRLQRAGDTIYNSITDAADEVQEQNIQVLDAAVANYETEISVARQAEIAHFKKELQHLTAKQNIPDIRKQLLNLQQQKQQKPVTMEQVQEQLDTTTGVWTQERNDLMAQIVQNQESIRVAKADMAARVLDTERHLNTRMDQRIADSQRDIKKDIQMLRDQPQAITHRVDRLAQQLQDVQEIFTGTDTAQWKEELRAEMQNHIRNFQSEVEALKTVVQELSTECKARSNTGTSTQDTTNTATMQQQPMFRGHPIDMSSTTTPMSAEGHYGNGISVDKAQQLANRSIMKDTQKFKREEMVFDLPMTDVLPHQRTMEGNYKMLHNAAVAYGFPLLPFHELQAHSNTTRPPEAPQTHDEETLQLISTTIYLKLNVVIPPVNEQLRVILRQQADGQDGYRALFGLMQLTCDHLRLIRHPWGPEWPVNGSVHEYFSTLQSKIQNESRQGRQYTPLEVAAEFLQQAIKQPLYVMTASQLLTELRGVALRQAPLPSHLEVGNIMATYQNIAPLMTPTGAPSINQVHFKDQSARKDNGMAMTIHQVNNGTHTAANQHNGNSRKPRNAIQCPACHKFGHSVAHQICHFAAQTVQAQDWIRENPKEAQSNAQAYKLSNAPRTVKKMELQFQELFKTDMTEADKEELRDRMVSTFTHGHHQEVTQVPTQERIGDNI